MTKQHSLLLLLPLGLAECRPPQNCSFPVEAMQCATQLVEPLPEGPTPPGQPRPVVVYFDRSGSMRGFLDPSFPNVATDFRSVIDRLAVRIQPAETYGFGSAVLPIKVPDLTQASFYGDSNTEMEQVFARVSADSDLSRTHVIVGDGRRGAPAAAIAQFMAMRDLARKWVDSGGTFVVGATMTRFKPVASDPSGCRANGTATDAAADSSEPQCPLYAFAFVAPGDRDRIAGAVAEVFQHVYLWPMHPMPAAPVALGGPGGASAVQLHPNWAQGPEGSPIVRTTAAAQTPTALRLQVQAGGPAGPLAERALQGQETRVATLSRPLSLPAQPWTAVSGPTALVQADPEAPQGIRIISYGPQSPAYVYQVDLLPTGRPAWIAEFSADSAADVRRTFGISRLFLAFEAAAANATPIARVHIVAN